MKPANAGSVAQKVWILDLGKVPKKKEIGMRRKDKEMK
jgi:hypothetical protein